ncbi:hypothetical protein OPKNFCMD_6597 [Methylobacterium crusticola]|uniref:DUF465 domain-containing protein n=1 Tax=Methylobacterium crusticola TaxID=1697972 RepID=A0ABQ4R7X7_9HYPH|nr:hypothetical protein [Methylobacterium crusticola]GJD53818.1 hypothetical protein OPKNFCMD_6597 [Methylobacterium crusticola]
MTQDKGERDRILELRLRHELLCERRIHDQALLAEIVQAWGQPE